MHLTPLAISNLVVPPHIPDVMDLCSGLIMNVSVGPMLFPKTQNLTESDKVNTVVLAIRHPMYLISGLIIEVSGVELCKYLLI
jgi:hypothetical protein